eukprot:scaffold2544_cov401-Prasinococcus_capsulatus_cf.AAC.2
MQGVHFHHPPACMRAQWQLLRGFLQGYGIRPHTDTNDKWVTTLFYLPPDEAEPNLGTEVCKSKSGKQAKSSGSLEPKVRLLLAEVHRLREEVLKHRPILHRTRSSLSGQDSSPTWRLPSHLASNRGTQSVRFLALSSVTPSRHATTALRAGLRTHICILGICDNCRDCRHSCTPISQHPRGHAKVPFVWYVRSALGLEQVQKLSFVLCRLSRTYLKPRYLLGKQASREYCVL